MAMRSPVVEPVNQLTQPRPRASWFVAVELKFSPTRKQWQRRLHGRAGSDGKVPTKVRSRLLKFPLTKATPADSMDGGFPRCGRKLRPFASGASHALHD